MLLGILNNYLVYIDDKPITKLNVNIRTIVAQYLAWRKKGIENYSAENYFLDIVSFSKEFVIDEEEPENWLVKGYDLIISAQELIGPIEKLSHIFSERGFIYKEIKSEHNREIKSIFDEMMPHFKILKKNDDLISDKGFDLMRKMEKGYMYKKIYKSFFNVTEFPVDKRGRDIVEEGTTGSILEYNSQKEYSNLSNGLNLYYDYEENLKYYKDQLKVIATF